MLRSSLRRHGSRLPSSDPTAEVLRAVLGPAVNAEVLRALAPFADIVEVGPCVELARAGMLPRQVTVLMEGQATVRPVDADEWIAGPGARFGELEVLSGVPLRSTVTTLGPSARVLVLFGPALGWAVAGLLAGAAPRGADLGEGA